MRKEQKDGMAYIAPNTSVPYRFKDGVLTLMLGDQMVTLDADEEYILGTNHSKLCGNNTLYHLSIPMNNTGSFVTQTENGERVEQSITVGNINTEVDFYIENYSEKSSYGEMRFSFLELDYFIPSAGACSKEEGIIAFSRNPTELCKFNFTYRGNEVTLILRISSSAQANVKCVASTKSELCLLFEKTNDFDFLLGLYSLVQELFVFICNHQNICLDSATLLGERLVSRLETNSDGNKKVIEKTVPVNQTLVIIDKYIEEPDETAAKKTIRYGAISSHFEQFFGLILEDKVSISSVHTSVKARNYINLKQSLHITAAFEYYTRTLLPEMSSQTTRDVYNDVHEMLTQFVKTLTGKKKKKAEDLLEGLVPMISLKDKIVKVYKGYGTWTGLSGVLDEWYSEKVYDLASVANKWRNELAHEKREYEPDIRVIEAIRLIEHINYSIVLCKAGYSDEEIKGFVEQVLTR